jgi:uncharacterized protein (DUF58 family)
MSVIFDQDFRRRLEVLKRIVARALAGRGGAGRSPLRDRGGRVEFASHRAYVPGDDASVIDWNVYGRLETLVVKEFEAPREAQLLLLLDRSDSMGLFGKDAAAVRTAAALGWLALAAGARVACAARGGASAWITATERFPELLDALEKLPVGGAAELPAAVERAPVMGTGRRTVVLFSDLYEAEPAARALAALRKRVSTVVCAHVIAPEELRAPDEPALILRDAESGESVQVRLDTRSRAAFHDAAERFQNERAELAVRHGARLVQVAPGTDLVLSVERLFL